MRTNAIVVEFSRSPLPWSWAPKADSSGTASASDFARRTGSPPPSASSRSRRYVISGESAGGRWKPPAWICSSERSSSKRSRNAISAFSVIFFCWWVMFWPSPASPIP